MFTHTVCFKFAEPGDVQEAARRLRSMAGRIPSMDNIEVGIDELGSARSYDLVLITRHADRAAMEAYQVHPVHQEVISWMKTRGPTTIAVDFTS